MRGRGLRLGAAVGVVLVGAGLWGCARPMGKAAWVVRTDLAAPQGPERVCKAARAAGLDRVLVQVRGRGDAYYASRLAPRAERLGGEGRDPLAEVLQACDGVDVHAWMNVFFVWHRDEPPADPGHVVHAMAEGVLADADGRRLSEYGPGDRALGWVEGIYLDPAFPPYRERFGQLVRELLERYPVRGVHLDFVRYPGPAFGPAGALGDLFRAAWGVDPQWIPEELRVPDLERWLRGEAQPGDRVLATAALLWADRRAAEVTALVRRVRRVLDEMDPGLELSAAVFPDPGPAYLEKGQDWRTWASRGLVDALYPMAYFGGARRVAAQLEQVAGSLRGAAPGVRLWAGLGAFVKPPDAIREEARAACRAGFDGTCLFDAGTVLEKHGALTPYARAVEERVFRSPAAANPEAARERPRTPGGRMLAAVLDRASGGRPPPVARAARRLDERWAEFERAVAGGFARAAKRMQGELVPTPPWVEARGVFRYIHPEDGSERREEQYRSCERARARLLGGEAFEEVARELSQGGTRHLGGALGRTYLDRSREPDRTLARLAVGETSPVVPVSNGCWVYRVEARGGEALLPWDEAPWAARREAFRQALNRELAEGALGGGGEGGQR